jgi:hypothetical protein
MVQGVVGQRTAHRISVLIQPLEGGEKVYRFDGFVGGVIGHAHCGSSAEPVGSENIIDPMAIERYELHGCEGLSAQICEAIGGLRMTGVPYP